MREAKELVKNIDTDDKIFVACALAYPNSILWSNDHRLKAIREITVKNTKEVIQLSQG
jgi:predicted nucleic acid-binding protein